MDDYQEFGDPDPYLYRSPAPTVENEPDAPTVENEPKDISQEVERRPAPVEEAHSQPSSASKDVDWDFVNSTLGPSGNPIGIKAGTSVPPAGIKSPISSAPMADKGHAMPTMFHAATQQPSGQEPVTLEGTLSEAGRNLIPSIKEQFTTFGHAISHPKETLSALGQVGTGIASKAAGAIGMQQDKGQKQQDEKIVDALWDHYKKTYFTSTDDFARAFGKDPAGIAMDFSTLLGAGEVALPAKAAEIASRAATLMDPIQASLSAARSISSIPVAVLRGAQATASKVPYSTLKDIYKMGLTGNSVAREGYNLGRELPETEVTRRAADAVSAAANDASASYIAGKSGLANKAPNTNEVLSRITQLENDLKIAGKVPDISMDANNQLQLMKQQLIEYSNNPDYNLFEADKYKRALYNQRRNKNLSGAAQTVVDQVAKSVRDSIAKVDPNYANVMDKWQQWINQSKGLAEGGANADLSTASSMAKLLKSMKSDLKKKNVIDVLAKHDPQLPHILAGYSTKEFLPGGITLAEALGGGLGYYGWAHPLGAIGGAAAGAALSSPRISAMSQRALGEAGKWGARATSRPISAGAYYGERGLQEEGQDQAQGTEQTSSVGGDMFDKMLMIESGNRQFDEKGMPIISNKGAIGAAQVKPDTAKQMAAELGIPFDDQKYRYDSSYNKQLGRAYYEKMLGIFKDPLKAAAAYNTGPGHVEDAMREAERSGGSWIDHLPYQQTKDYVRNLVGHASGGRIERASGGKVDGDLHEKLVQRLMNMTKQAKKVSDKTTEPLLNAPDEAIVKALGVAQEAI